MYTTYQILQPHHSERVVDLESTDKGADKVSGPLDVRDVLGVLAGADLDVAALQVESEMKKIVNGRLVL